jgi:putative DNA primase/helicase
VDEDGATIFLDEVDRIKNRERREDLTRLLNGSTSRAFGWVERCETTGRKITRRSFRVFGPKAVAAIGANSAPDTFRDRSLHIEMQRRPKSEGPKVKLRREESAFEDARRQMARWAADVGEKLGDPPDYDFPEFTSERHEEAWEPLLEIAQVAGENWPDRAWAALESLTQPNEDAESWRVALLRDTHTLYQELGDDGNISRDRLCNALKFLDEPSRPWATWGKDGTGLNPTLMRKALKDYGLATQEVWDAGQKVRGYRWDDFFDPWDRYLDV